MVGDTSHKPEHVPNCRFDVALHVLRSDWVCAPYAITTDNSIKMKKKNIEKKLTANVTLTMKLAMRFHLSVRSLYKRCSYIFGGCLCLSNWTRCKIVEVRLCDTQPTPRFNGKMTWKMHFNAVCFLSTWILYALSVQLWRNHRRYAWHILRLTN